MKIVCDNCATKYSIADEKVRGKVFKIRCKKCSHIIVVKGTEGDAAVDAGAADAPAETAEPAGDGWHVVVNGEQVGPLSSQEVRGKFSGGEIDAETFAWKEGFGDWQRLASIDEFRDLQAAPAAPAADMTRRSGAPTAEDLFGGGEQTTAGNNDLFGSPGGDLFAGASSPAAAPAPAPATGGGLFAQPAAAPEPQRRSPTPGFGSPAVDSAPAPAAAAAPPASGGKLTGQRNENSVLFSLNNLQALASGGPAKSGSSAAAPAPSGGVENRPGFANSQTEGSGLIDIRAMAAATLSTSPSASSSSSNNDLPSFSSAPVFSPIAAPILMPAASTGPPKWLWPVLGVAGLAMIVMIGSVVVILTRKPEQVAVAPAAATAPAAAVAAPVAAAPAVAGATAPAAAAPTAAALTAATPTAAADKHAAKSGPAAGKPVKGAVPGTKIAKADTAPAATPEPAAPTPVAKPKKSSKDDDLDALLGNATNEKPKAAAHESAPAADDNLPDQLDKAAIVSGMKGVSGNVAGCYKQFNVPGMANVSVTIVKTGRIQNASVTGAFAGTPTGDCVAKAVKGASFTKFKGAPQTITYPYMLR